MSQRTYSRRKAKGFFAEMQALILHPVAFFEALPEQGESRTWLMAALLILALVGYSAIQQKAAMPEDFATVNPVQAQVITGLMAASTLLLAWIVQAFLILPVAMLSKKAPKFSLNLHIAIWSSLPFAILALIQIAYLWAGGPIGGAGLAPLMTTLLPYEMLNTGMGYFLINLAEHLTLFGLWNLALLYLGARHSIQGTKGNFLIILVFLLLWLLVLLAVTTMIDVMSVQQGF